MISSLSWIASGAVLSKDSAFSIKIDIHVLAVVSKSDFFSLKIP